MMMILVIYEIVFVCEVVDKVIFMCDGVVVEVGLLVQVIDVLIEVVIWVFLVCVYKIVV